MQSLRVLRVFTGTVAAVAAAACASAPSPAAAVATPASRPDTTRLTPTALLLRDFQEQSTPMLEAGNYLGIVELLDHMRAMAGRDSDAQSTVRQLTGTYASFVGQPQDALEAFAFSPATRPPFDTAALSHLVAEDAVVGVTRLAARRQVIFINEAHHVPRDRAFVASLLPKLRALGFSYLAVETLAEADTGLNARGYPVRASGFYSNEPMFGDMLRTALKLGFKLVPYESPSPTQDEREMGQARHIVDRVLKADPKAKLVVYAGYDHINESGDLGGAKPMAVRFRELTGIDPLTVDQTVMTEQADTTYEDSRYLYLMKHVARQAPYVLRTGDSLWSAKPGVHDVTVIHPHAVHRAGRPNWLYALGGRRAYLLSDELCSTALDCLVSARIAGEREDAVPIDVLRVQFSAPGSKTFALPPGQYVIEARDSTGAVVKRQSVTINAANRQP